MAAVNFRSADRTLILPGRARVKAFIGRIFTKERFKLKGITYVFCSDAFLLQMNRNFLQHDYYTDIITFTLSEKGHPVESEIYISTDRVKDNARSLGIPYRQEMLRVIFHGALHLCGYKDKKKSEIALMRSKEDQYLRLFEKIRADV
ncbi:MAG: rRNA maturation RNase YbeY [Bacteroidota bacterium]